MSNDNAPRHPAGQPVGGQFAEKLQATSGLVLDETPAHQIPIELPSPGDETYFDGDGELVQQYRVAKDDEDGTYRAQADMFYMRMNGLTGTETLDDDVADDLAGPGSARGRFAMQMLSRHFGAELTEQGDDGDVQFVPEVQFDTAPTEEDVVNKLWPTVARIANETDPGTFGSPYVGNQLREELDEHAFLEPDIGYEGGQFVRHGLLVQEEARDEVVRLHRTGEPISDGTARTLAQGLALSGHDSSYSELHNLGYTDRADLATAVYNVVGTRRTTESAAALAHWAKHQETTTDLVDRLTTQEAGNR